MSLKVFDQLEVINLTPDKIQSYTVHSVSVRVSKIFFFFKKVQGISFSVHELQL